MLTSRQSLAVIMVVAKRQVRVKRSDFAAPVALVMYYVKTRCVLTPGLPRRFRCLAMTGKGRLMQRRIIFWLTVIGVGVAAGCGALALHYLINLMHNLFYSQQFSFAFNVSHKQLPAWQVILTPALGGLLVVYIIRHFAPEARGHGVPQVIEAVRNGNAHIRPRVAVVRALAASLCIGSGGSGGVEGPIVQIGAALASLFNKYVPRLREKDRPLMLACAAAGGVAAGFNAPIAGVLFAAELILPKVTPKTIMAVTVASIAATFVAEDALGKAAFFNLLRGGPLLDFSHDYVAYALLGILAGIVASGFIWLVHSYDKWAKRVRLNAYVLHGLAMLCLGLVLYAMSRFAGGYYIDGASYGTITSIISGPSFSAQFLLLLLVSKLTLTCLTLSTGGSAGVFSPSLFAGAACGAIFYLVASPYFPGMEGHYAGFAIAGMAGVAGAATAALMTAVMVVLEMTNQYQLLLPVMLVVVTAAITRDCLSVDTLYYRKPKAES